MPCANMREAKCDPAEKLMDERHTAHGKGGEWAIFTDKEASAVRRVVNVHVGAGQWLAGRRGRADGPDQEKVHGGARSLGPALRRVPIAPLAHELAQARTNEAHKRPGRSDPESQGRGCGRREAPCDAARQVHRGHPRPAPLVLEPQTHHELRVHVEDDVQWTLKSHSTCVKSQRRAVGQT